MASAHEDTEEVDSPEVHFVPIVMLKPVEVVTLEEDEEVLLQLRAKLFRFDKSTETPEWKERGTGNVKIMRHTVSNLVRVLMRRDKTLKICANHYIQPEMELRPNCSNEKAWIWTTPADFSDDEAKSELLAIRFGSVENAQKWKEAFTKAQEIMKEAIPKHNAQFNQQKSPPTDKVKPVENGTTEDSANTKTESKEHGSGDTTVASSSDTKQDDTVVDKLESLTVKDKSDKPESNNKTDDEKVVNTSEAKD